MADDRERKSDVDPDEPSPRGRFSRLGEQITGLLDPEGALRRGQDLVTGVTQATKDEVIRIISAEVKNFLDKMDAAELMQQVIAGLVVDVNMQIRFSREDPQGPAQPKITKASTKMRSEPTPADRRSPKRDRDRDPDDEG